jgi:ABC-type antimicrobial peptide transport system permease subunit
MGKKQNTIIGSQRELSFCLFFFVFLVSSLVFWVFIIPSMLFFLLSVYDRKNVRLAYFALEHKIAQAK